MLPKTKYARSDDVRIAYQISGDGPFDVVWAPGTMSHLDLDWEIPQRALFFERFSKFCRLIRFDKRGTGLSDRPVKMATLEERTDDIRAVMDDVGIERANIFGVSEGGSMAVLFSAFHPARTSALILCGTVARLVRDEGYPWGLRPEQLEDLIRLCEEQWGGPVMIDLMAPSMAHDAEYRDRYARRLRMGASPGAAVGYIRMNFDVDVRGVLPAVRVPTLVLQRTGDRLVQLEAGRDLAARIPGARFVELPGEDHTPWVGDIDPLIGEVEEFLTGIRHGPEEDRVLATVLFTDIVSSTERAGEMGDRGWKELLDAHDHLTRQQVERFRGRVVKFTGDGVLATFDGPARAVRCAASLRDAVADLGVEVRAGLHTGEIQVRGEDIGGIAVHIAQRICSGAGSREIVASSTVKDLVAGSGLSFADRGLQTLRGVPDKWRSFTVMP